MSDLVDNFQNVQLVAFVFCNEKETVILTTLRKYSTCAFLCSAVFNF